ncbi:MAG: Putative glycolate oxidase iron-sulfur subunit GlcF [Thermoanaerobacterales bacterium 50_218]|nr:MAG: Putative glycolate oxidase iron-sulfur subunit GlcF [Thermoanaerobacterales bacterium 50_218]HAA90221.1 (Fe-S)-binding protein [Peptococcaceae bacterium]
MIKVETVKTYLDRCSKCGGCQAVCPLYGETMAEPLVARGKLFLIKNHIEGKLELSPKMKELMSLCLLCKACMENCPNKIPVDQLVLWARQKIAQEKGISFVKKNIFQHLLKNNGRLTIAARLGYFYQHSGLQWLVRKSRLLELFGDLAKKESLLPEMAKVPFRNQVPRLLPVSRPQKRVAYFTGCLTNFVFPDIGYAVINVLRNNGVEVVIPEQWCCGIPALASGDEETAVDLARKNVKVFQRENVDAIITDCASCGSTLKEYAELLETPEARSFAEKVLDFSQLLADVVGFQPGEEELSGLVVTYHDPCHLRRGMGISEAPRSLIKAVPGVTFKEMKESDRCCGAAGSFNLTYYELAVSIGRRKAKNVQDTGANVLLTACPSCIMQLRHVLQLEGSDVQVLHLAQLLDKTYSNAEKKS